MLYYRDVTKIYYPNIVALENVSFGIQPGEFVSLVGKSGAGKSTLLKLLLVEDHPTSGEIILDGEDVANITGRHVPEFRRKLGFVFQDYRLLPAKTVYENVAYVLEVMGVEEELIARDVSEVLDLVGLDYQARKFPAQLSGGEKQRVAIARALIHRPRMIIADEPTGDLDPYNARDIIRLLVKINKMGTTIMLATHNKEIINRLGKRVIALENGKLIRDEERGRFVI